MTRKSPKGAPTLEEEAYLQERKRNGKPGLGRSDGTTKFRAPLSPGPAGERATARLGPPARLHANPARPHALEQGTPRRDEPVGSAIRNMASQHQLRTPSLTKADAP